MQREIKFRLWDEDLKVMIYPGDDISYEYSIVPSGLVRHCDYGFRGDINVMLDTGLKDKNGVKIYEGDIVKNENDKKPNQQIIFARGMFCLDDEESHLWRYNPRSFWEVIGNVKENPELLK